MKGTAAAERAFWGASGERGVPIEIQAIATICGVLEGYKDDPATRARILRYIIGRYGLGMEVRDKLAADWYANDVASGTENRPALIRFLRSLEPSS